MKRFFSFFAQWLFPCPPISVTRNLPDFQRRHFDAQDRGMFEGIRK